MKLGSKIVDIVDEGVKFLHKATPIYNFISLHLFKEIDEGEKFFYYLLEKSWFLTKQTNTKRLNNINFVECPDIAGIRLPETITKLTPLIPRNLFNLDYLRFKDDRRFDRACL